MKHDKLNIAYLSGLVLFLVGIGVHTIIKIASDYSTSSEIKNLLLKVTSFVIHAAWPLIVLTILIKTGMKLVKLLQAKDDEEASFNDLKEMKILAVIFAAAAIGFAIICIVFATVHDKAQGELILPIIGFWSCFIMANIQFGAVKLFRLLKEKGS